MQRNLSIHSCFNAYNIDSKQDKPVKLNLKSPRTLAAWNIIGVMPFQLKRISLKMMLEHSSTPEIAKIRYDYQEKKRLELVSLVSETRDNIIANNQPGWDICESCNLPIQGVDTTSFVFLPKSTLIKRKSMENFSNTNGSVKDMRTQSSHSNKLSTRAASICTKCRGQRKVFRRTQPESASIKVPEVSPAMERLHQLKKKLK